MIVKKKRLKQEIDDLNKLIRESDGVNRLLKVQVDGLKEDIRELERSQNRENANMDYLKNIIVKYMETHDDEVNLPHSSFLFFIFDLFIIFIIIIIF